VWQGDEFEALTIVRSIDESFTQEELKSISDEAKKILKEIETENRQMQESFIYDEARLVVAPSFQRIKAQIFVRESAKKGYNFFK
jgi:hypothetical protein